MKNFDFEIKRVIYLVCTISILQISYLTESLAQYPGINDSIAKYRKGEIIVRAKPGDKVLVEQLNHEFWFGCAISNGLAGGYWPENDIKQYKEKFLENFPEELKNRLKIYSEKLKNRFLI